MLLLLLLLLRDGEIDVNFYLPSVDGKERERKRERSKRKGREKKEIAGRERECAGRLAFPGVCICQHVWVSLRVCFCLRMCLCVTMLLL